MFFFMNIGKILGVSFFQGTVKEACQKAQCGGLVVAPSGPGMAHDLQSCKIYAKALLNADLTLLDSGFRLPEHLLCWALLVSPVAGVAATEDEATASQLTPSG